VRERRGEESTPVGNKSGKVGDGTANEAIRGCYVGMHYVVMPISVNWLAVDRFIISILMRVANETHVSSSQIRSISSGLIDIHPSWGVSLTLVL
jgi:hypothetical protein